MADEIIVETKQSLWHSLATRLAETRADVIRSTTLTPLTEPLEQAELALAQIGDSAEREFWGILEQIAAVTRLVEPTSETVRLTAQFRDLFNVSPADSAVLATVAEVRRVSSENAAGRPVPDGRSSLTLPRGSAKT